MSTKYTSIKKKELAKRITDTIKEKYGKDKSIEISEKIFKIINDNNKDFEYTKNSSGIIFFFNGLTDNTYTKIEHYLNSLEKKAIQQITDSIDKNNDMINTELDTEFGNTSTGSDKNQNPKYKLSNKEKNILKRREYEVELEKDNGTFEETHEFGKTQTIFKKSGKK
jgi:hypothetical protein